MGINSLQGSFGIGAQSAKAAAATTSIKYIPASSVSMQPEQAATSLGPEVGGGLWSKTSYKTGVMVTGDAAFNVRNDSVGVLLLGLMGAVNTTGAAAPYTHTFGEPANPSNLPYMTVNKNNSDVWTEQYLDCRVDTARFDVPAAGIVTATVGFVGGSAKYLANPTETFDSSMLFETAPTGSALLLGGAGANKATRVSLDFANNLSRDEQVIGSYYLVDISVVRRSCRITMDTFLTDSAWYRQVYSNNAALTPGADIFDPAIFSTDLSLKVVTAKDLASGDVGSMEFIIPNIDFLTFPVALQGNDIIRVTCTAELTFTGANALTVELVNDQAATYYTAS